MDHLHPINDLTGRPVPADQVADAIRDVGELVLRLGTVERKTLHPDGETPESVTTHTVMVAYVACALAEALAAGGVDIDPGQVAAEAVLHDVHEAIAGDVDTLRLLTREQRAAKQAAEHQAGVDIARQFVWIFPWFKTVIPAPGPPSRARRLVNFADKLTPKITHILNNCAVPHTKGVTVEELTHRYAVQRDELLREAIFDMPYLISIYDDLVARELHLLGQR